MEAPKCTSLPFTSSLLRRWRVCIEFDLIFLLKGELEPKLTNGKILSKFVSALMMTTDNCEVPYVERKEYQLVDIDEEGFLALYDEGTPKKDIRIGDSGVDAELREAFETCVNSLVSLSLNLLLFHYG